VKKHFDFVIITLTYENSQDIMDFIVSAKLKIQGTFKIIIVNSFFDNESQEIISDIAKKENCDFLPIENKGYGYGNNQGINWALEHYDFKYLIISNPDIEILNLSVSDLNSSDEIIGPNIRTLSGKKQNPYFYFKLGFIEMLKYYAFKFDSKTIFYFGIIINKFLRESMLFINRILNKDKFRVYALHGSFIIFNRNVFEKMKIVFYEKMFLFSEEVYLAWNAKKLNLKLMVNNRINVLHKEDGSVTLIGDKVSKYEKESFFEYYLLKKGK